MLDFLHEKVIRFKGSILGFEEFDRFSVSVVEENSAYAYLQSLDNENIGFLVVTPFIFYPEYAFEVEEKEKASLALQSQEDVAVLNTVTIREPFTKSTVNLLAPLIINVSTGEARQHVLPPGSHFGTNEPLFKPSLLERGEQGC